ncbi:hypothetical protein A2291_03335 [candidate division WOR-1 bacterium RIFOXYB2_FULL_42_35]|uniref:Uncharacterized protein n=1 Tax=candidate division WOR-1 bacterium RIFOXYC2_FULL_41_25 TaxID=1802586 RepID=A0A1F4TRW4_UNCSA|nr:MAG: hypothetical protein A2247_02610 [candidate division WOR-1 bacterium RIFOXYA2_FULL_41_14]OGC25774.1 MAG: hypothetical protein A2291_03335 [candidate division WOR-1 bacterium RIFOXYB2_FULL_42_35]OGC35408.1 MAG: hypothetical protein A2462_02565 [candidate division WOR-1 bacterium RIFOXYC2_FULL_41_25]OGC42440.1 MAG: hypothetical protein A2548_01915 [candidate division WOR-1 bacterium RIFOXYD2_FULL_41_8]
MVDAATRSAVFKILELRPRTLSELINKLLELEPKGSIVWQDETKTLYVLGLWESSNSTFKFFPKAPTIPTYTNITPKKGGDFYNSRYEPALYGPALVMLTYNPDKTRNGSHLFPYLIGKGYTNFFFFYTLPDTKLR